VVGARDFNVFSYIYHDLMFMSVMLVVLFVQWSACNWLSFLFDTVNLDGQMFNDCVACGFTSLIVACVLKLIPVELTEKIPVVIDDGTMISNQSVIIGIYEKLDSSVTNTIERKE